MNKFLLVALLLVIPLAQAQPAGAPGETEFSQTYYARAAIGDIPTTAAVEPAGQVNLVEYVRFEHAGQTEIALGGAYDSLLCSCGSVVIDGDTARVTNQTEAGSYLLQVTRSGPTGQTFGIPIGMYNAAFASDAQLSIYVPAGSQATTPVSPASILPGSNGPWDIYTFTGTNSRPLPENMWVAVHPELASAPVIVQDKGFGYFELVAGILVGALIWFYLVQKGMVQARSRKQVTQTSAHVEAAQSESKDVLAARKRVLMAGLKELEVAKMKKEMDDSTYDKLKGELKREAVTTMRALESAE